MDYEFKYHSYFPDGDGEDEVLQLSYQVGGPIQDTRTATDVDDPMSHLRTELSGTLNDLADLKNENHRKTLVAGLMEAQGRLPGDIDKKLLSDNTMIQRKRRLALVNSIRDKEKYAPRGFFTTKLMSPRNLKRIARDISLLECRPFAALVFDKLPRELRDQVYDYLWQGVDADFLDREISCVPEFFHRNDDNEWVLRAPFYAAADFVGPHFAREAALWYFQKLTNAEVDYKAVHDFLRMKEFGNQAFTPVTTLRTLNIALDWDISNRSKENYYIDQDALRFNLQSLLTLKPHEDFSVVLYLDRNLQFSREMFHALETIRPIYHDVVKSGLNFKVLGFRFFTPAWRRNGSKKVTRPIKATSEQLNHYFEMNPEDWLVLIGKELNQIKQRDRRRACQQILENMWVNFMDICETLPWKNWPGNESAESWKPRGPRGSVYLTSPPPSPYW